jgi:hypothetical protein
MVDKQATHVTYLPKFKGLNLPLPLAPGERDFLKLASETRHF